jgi:hypothetical protein
VRNKLVFLARSATTYHGSRFLRSTQLCEIVQAQLPDLDVQAATDDHEVSDAVVILNKSFLAAASPRQIQGLRARGNVVLADFVDLRPRRSLCGVVDGFLASSHTQERFLRRAYPDKPTFMIPHHADPRIEAGCAEGAAPRVGYFGHLDNARHIKRLAAEGLCDKFFVRLPEDTHWISRLSDYGVHYAVRRRKLFEGFKPFTKGAVAARCGAVVLADRDEETIASLGEDYPFFVESTAYEDVCAAIARVRESHGGPDWRAAQDALRRLDQQCSPEAIAQGLLGAMSATQPGAQQTTGQWVGAPRLAAQG